MSSPLILSLINDFGVCRPAVPELDLLNGVRLSGVIKGDAQLRAPWGVDLPMGSSTIALYLVEQGQCIVETEDSCFIMEEGDALLVPAPIKLSMANRFDTPRQSLFDFIDAEFDTSTSAEEQLRLLFAPNSVPDGLGALTRIVTVRMYTDKHFPLALLNSLPSHVLLKAFLPRCGSSLDMLLQQIAAHGAKGFLGQSIAVRLAESILIMFLSDHLHTFPTAKKGVHGALRDPQMAKVLGALQHAPTEDWCVARMAAIASLSRSAFLERFTSLVGQSPSQFLLELRMALAAGRLENSSMGIIEIALQAGYGSEAAFNRAFHRWSGKTPGNYRAKSKTSPGF